MAGPSGSDAGLPRAEETLKDTESQAIRIPNRDVCGFAQGWRLGRCAFSEFPMQMEVIKPESYLA